MFRLENIELFDDDVHLGTIKKNYSAGQWQPNDRYPKSVFIILDSKFKSTASPHFLKALRKFVSTECETSFAIVRWF